MADIDAKKRLLAMVEAHTALFNSCVRSGDWTPFMDTFADDARLTITNLPIPPVQGRPAIAAAYARRPPTEAMSLTDVESVDDDTVQVSFVWESGREGTMLVRWQDGLVSRVDFSM
jgi:hypothetical protein